MDSNGVGPGEVGGVFAGIVALLVAIGKGTAWLLGWQERQDSSRSAKLDAWHRELASERDRLAAREQKIDQETEDRFAKIEAELKHVREVSDRWGTGFVIVANGLHRVAPLAPEMAIARRLLGDMFPLHLRLPEEIADLAERADAALDGGEG